MGFIHLHTHSDYSLLRGLPKIIDLVEAAKKEKQTAVALTDSANFYGAIEFYQACAKKSVKPIIGVEIFLCESMSHLAFGRQPIHPNNLILLCQNYSGFQNALRLITEANLRGMWDTLPFVDESTLAQFGRGLFCLTGTLHGSIPQLFRNQEDEKAERTLRLYQTIFGRDNVILQIAPQALIPEQPLINEKIIALGKKTNSLVVATNNVHYINKDDAEAQNILVWIGEKKTIENTDPESMKNHDFSFRSEEEMRLLFPSHPEVITNTEIVASHCSLELPLGKIQIPGYRVDDHRSVESILHELCVQGFQKRYHVSPDEFKTIASDLDHPLREIVDRFEYECDIISKTGFASYFLIVQDIVNWAKSKSIVVGPGRGSAAGSLVSYLLNITNIDPLQYDLLFERFLNPERISMPDIDLDFADARRDEVIEYVKKKYGEDHVAHIITFGTLAARAAVRDVGRVLGLPYSFCDRIAKLIPMFCDLSTAISQVEELQTLRENDPDCRNLLDIALKLEGVSRHASIHACGILITKGPLTDHAPVQCASGEDRTLVSQFSLHPIEDLGLLKMDFLGLRNLTVIEQTLKIIHSVFGTSINIDSIPVNDQKTFKLFQRGETTGVFQFESAGMKRYLRQLKPNEFEDIIAMVALYRPGPMEFIPDFIAGKHGTKTVHYLHPKLEPILKKTYGIAVYQEQIMQIARDICGFTLGEADVLRKAIGKKIKSLLLEQRDKFVEGGIRNGVPKKTSTRLFDFFEPFARYGFNRSHAACYALIGYQTAYLKANYPSAFLASLMTSDLDNTDRIAIEVAEAKRLGIEVLPPDINESDAAFAVIAREGKNDCIRFGLSAIKNVGAHLVESIIRERKKNGLFRSIENFFNRIQDKDLNKKSLESLIKAGAFDSFRPRSLLLHHIDLCLQFHRSLNAEKKIGQANLFQSSPVQSEPKLSWKKYPEIPLSQLLAEEKKLLGLYISNHPLAELQQKLSHLATPWKEAKNMPNGSIVRIAGIITKIQFHFTKQKEKMAFVSVEDLTGNFELIVFPKIFLESAKIWLVDQCVLVTGTLDLKDDSPKIIARAVKPIPLDRENRYSTKSSAIQRHDNEIGIIVTHHQLQSLLPELSKLLSLYPGSTPVSVLLQEGDRFKKIRTKTKIHFSDILHEELSKLLARA